MQALPLKALSPDGLKRKIIVRLSRIWEAKNRDTGHVYELAFAAVDHEGTVMEGNVPVISMAQFKDVLKEGTIYTIQGFMVKPARRKYRTLDNDHRITITQYTKVEQAVPEPLGILLVAHSLQPLSVLEKRARSVIVLSDVLGLVTDMTGLIPPKGQGQPRRNIKIKDIDGHQFTITLWGHQAENFDEESVRASSAQGSVAILFVSMTIDHYLAKLCFMATSLTRSYINIPIPEMSTLRARYRINVKARDIGYTEEDEEEIGCFTFFGKQGKILTGYDEELVIGTAEGRPNYLPPAIANVVGRKYLVTARVNQEIYAQDNIPFRVSTTELIGSPAPLLQAASNTNPPPEVPSPELIGSPAPLLQAASNTNPPPEVPSPSPAKEAPGPSEGNRDSVATPPTDAIETLDSDAEENTPSASEKKKRKGRTTASPSAKKQISKNLFPKK
ncbi:hypothetical protein ACQ4PT_067809 [Festuca glaucescens]